MPTRAKRLCSRCGQLIEGRRCTTCEGRWHYATTLRRVNDDPYDNPAWRAFSRAFLRDHPFCECPDHGSLPEWRRPLSEVTDHIDGLGPNGPRGFDRVNCQAMTRSCHAKKTIKHDGGYGRKRNPLVPPNG